MTDWLHALKATVMAGGPAALVTIADAKGSAPREAGVKMLVTASDTVGTVGGGNLEHQAIRIARSMLEKEVGRSALRSFALGPSLGQCCGGSTRLLFDAFQAGAALPRWIHRLIELDGTRAPAVLASRIEGGGGGGEKAVITPDFSAGDLEGVEPGLIDQARRLLDPSSKAGSTLWTSEAGETYLLEKTADNLDHVVLIGAGHVGKALARVLAPLPFHLTWADNRPEQFPDEIDPSIRVRCTPHLTEVIDEAPAGAMVLVMTYSHDLDYALCARVLQRGDHRYLGLIGSKSKRAKFERTMADLGIDHALTKSVVCPIGLPGIDSKQPAVIAVATAAQLLALGPARPEQ